MFQTISRRYVIVILGFFSFAILNAQRVNVVLALVAMTNPSAPQMTPNQTGLENDRNSERNLTKIYIKPGTYNWDVKTQGYIISGSFVGFVLTQILGGRLSEVFGAKQMLCFGILWASICNIFSPLAAYGGVYFFMAVQFTKGMAQGFLQPAISCLMGRWYPEEERSFLTSFTFSGFPAGALVGGIVSGILCDSDTLGGWPSVFYLFGFAGIIIFILEVLFIFNSPEEYEQSTSSKSAGAESEKIPKTEEKLKIPWLRMLLSVPTLALLVAMIGQYWMTFYFLSVHQVYLSEVLNLDITENGLFSSLPYILQIVVTWLGSSFSDWIIRKNYASTNTVRKCCNTISCLGFSLSMFGVLFAKQGIVSNILCFFIAMASVGLGFPGSLTVPMDMTKNFAGTLMGSSGTIASSSGFIIPVIVGYIVENKGSFTQWCKVMSISIIVVAGSGFIFHTFGSAELQDWDSPSAEFKKCPENIDKNKQLRAINSIA